MKSLSRTVKDRVFVWSIVIPAILFFIIFVYYPFAKNVYYMFCDYNYIKAPVFSGLKNIQQFITDSTAHRALFNTFAITIFSVPLVLVVSLGAALAVFSMKRGKNFIRSALFATFLVPPVVASVIFKLMFGTESGLINTVLNTLGLPSVGWLISPGWALAAITIVHVWNGTGYYMVIFLAGLSNINRQLYEAARVDGANGVQVFRYITVPQLKPTIIFSMIYATITYLRSFALVEILTEGGPYRSTETIIMYMFKQGFQSRNVGYASVIAVVVFLITLVISLIQMKLTKYYDD